MERHFSHSLNTNVVLGMVKVNRTWTNGIPVHYENWQAGQPNGGNTSQPLVSLQRGHGLQYADYVVGGDHGYICETGGGKIIN